MNKDMVYVAVKPETPDMAYAICVCDNNLKKLTAEYVAEWIKEGANVLLVTEAVGLSMFDKYLASRPKQESLPYED